jgi:hypothetical protein
MWGMKSEVYSWRVSVDLKTELEREARRRKMSLSAALDLAAREWLERCGARTHSNEEQSRLQNAASKCFGVLASGDAYRSGHASQAVRQRLRWRNGR